jgi:DNA repair photolyase
MQITVTDVKSILTPQNKGFLASGPYPFSHTLSAYTGCGFGQTTCGMYCYAQFQLNWSLRGFTAEWGHAVQVKQNAAQLLERKLERMPPTTRQKLRIFMSSATDPYQPIEREHQVTRQCLEVFARYPDLDLLIVQTRSPLAERDLPLMRQIPYLWLSVTIETDDQEYLKRLKGGPVLWKRRQLVRDASASGVPTQITVSPCLPYSEAFAQQLLTSGAQRLVIDTTVDGDGSQGERTARSSFARAVPGWAETTHAHALYQRLLAQATDAPIAIGWSNPGFCGIPPRWIPASEVAHTLSPDAGDR